MVERIKEIILNEGLTSGNFADLIGVQRSSMSHILNGRNNPSLDFIVKTLQTFPKVNPEWLLTGAGPMLRSNAPDQATQPVRERSIFDSVPEPVAKTTLVPEVKHVEIQPDPVKNLEKYVDKVLIFYSDHTYDEFIKTQKTEF
ncbi:MAG: helix-turn-helix transcriptional regulator [Bacteroidales bacterium]|jgi:transcriptional regulator with XRE-family HTH domain